jgi:hypothetical protein
MYMVVELPDTTPALSSPRSDKFLFSPKSIWVDAGVIGKGLRNGLFTWTTTWI